MVKIKGVKGRQVFDSRGNPTVEAEVFLDNGMSATAISPSGASTGAFEAHELRDKDDSRYQGLGTIQAATNAESMLKFLSDISPEDQLAIDERLIELDGTKNKSKLGANAILSVSINSTFTFDTTAFPLSDVPNAWRVCMPGSKLGVGRLPTMLPFVSVCKIPTNVGSENMYTSTKDSGSNPDASIEIIPSSSPLIIASGCVEICSMTCCGKNEAFVKVTTSLDTTSSSSQPIVQVNPIDRDTSSFDI